MADDAYVKAVCKFFYGSEPSEVNDKLKEVAAKMLWAAIEKSKALDLVPRPPGGRPGIAWLVSQAVQAFFRSQANTKIYDAARKAVAYQYKTEYELARQGVE
jgi:hypothetical protein